MESAGHQELGGRSLADDRAARAVKHVLTAQILKCCPVRKGRAFALAASTTGTLGAIAAPESRIAGARDLRNGGR